MDENLRAEMRQVAEGLISGLMDQFNLARDESIDLYVLFASYIAAEQALGHHILVYDEENKEQPTSLLNDFLVWVQDTLFKLSPEYEEAKELWQVSNGD